MSYSFLEEKRVPPEKQPLLEARVVMRNYANIRFKRDSVQANSFEVSFAAYPPGSAYMFTRRSLLELADMFRDMADELPDTE